MGINYWLDGWLEANKIRTAEEAMTILSDPFGFDEVIDVARQWNVSPPELLPTDDTLLAGPGFDLDVTYHCGNPVCRRSDVERLLRHSFPYYEKIFMPDTLGALITSSEADAADAVRLDKIRNGIEIFLELKAVGALPLLHYFPRSQSGRDIHMDILLNGSDEAKDQLRTADAEFCSVLTDGFTFNQVAPGIATVSHSAVPGRVWSFSFPLLEPDIHYQSLMVGGALLGEYIAKLFETATYAERFAIPIGHADPLYSHFERILSRSSSAPQQFNMPSLIGIPLQQLIDLRLNNPTQFSQIRQELHQAMSKLNVGEPGSQLDTAVIAPALHELEAIMAESAKKIRRELGLSGIVVSIATVFTVMQGFSLLPLLPVVAGGISPTVSAYLERRQKLAENPYTLLWKATHSSK